MNKNQANNNTTVQDAAESTLFVVLPENIDELVNLTEKTKLISTDFGRGYALYKYLFGRRAGMTHAEAIAQLKTLDYAEAEWAYRNK